MISLRRLSNVAGFLGTILKWFSLVFLVPMAFAVWYGTSILPFLVPLSLSALVGAALEWRFTSTDLEMADGFALVVLSWLAVSSLGAIPYVMAGVDSVAQPLNAFFESASGFTCTGSTVLNDISLGTHSHAIMIWRQLTQWLGGMGILVLAVAVLPRLSVGGAQFLDNEVPGPRMDRLSPHMAETARRLWLLYVGASVLLFVIFCIIYLVGADDAMNPYQALAHTLTTIPSGGFSPQADSVASFSPVVQWVMIPFMLVAGMNFTLLWRAIFKGPRELEKNTEFKVYMTVFVLSGILIAAILVTAGQYNGWEEAARHGSFQIATVLTSTGFASADFALWPSSTLVLLIFLMFSCGCVGSTSGGLKILRWIMALKSIYRELIQQIHPTMVRPLRVGSRVLKEGVIKGAMILIVVYLLLFGVSSLIVAIDCHIAGLEMTIMDITSGIAATLGNVGPGVGQVGPMGNFEFLPSFTKGWMCFLMIAGRLEIITFLVMMTPRYWQD